MILARFRKDPAREAALALYVAAVEQARKPRFYLDVGVADSFEGRFELLALHAFLILRRLKAEPGGARIAQAFVDQMFSSLDDSLRADGVGDLVVAKKVRALAEAFYGRCAAYSRGFDADAPGDALPTALSRNVYESHDPTRGAPLADYARSADHLLAGQSLMGGIVGFPDA
jgi:cytochrome b pre-mRNA-processing protein 3